MFCGAASFPRVDEDPGSPPTPKGPRRKHGSNNPYSTRGLDKYSTLLADLASRRERIMAKAGAEGVSVVRFVYSNSHDWVPIVVRTREQRPEVENDNSRVGSNAKDQKKRPDAAAREQTRPAAPKRVVKKSFCWKVQKREDSGVFGWKPSYFWPTVVVLILLCLVFGRAFAICCTSIWWYLVPCMKVDEGHSVRKSMKRKLGAGGGDGAAMAALAKKDGDLVGLASPRHHRTSTAKRGPR